MIEADKRKAISLLHQEGMSAHEISRLMKCSRNTAEAIILQKGEMPHSIRKDKIRIDSDLLERLYEECNGYAQRVQEKLAEEEGITVTYSTLTRMLRELDLKRAQQERCGREPDCPGAEMQHDTSEYRIMLGGSRVKLIGSLLYMRYSKRRYVKFYRVFNRFKMKCFFHEALMFWGYAAKDCIIDNTNLARLRGLGKDAVIVPEMEAFAEQYGFTFRCHARNHSNRKAGNERSFFTVTTNFLPGRTFSNLEDINKQALDWATVRMDHRPQSKERLIPVKVFEHEKHYLVKLFSHLPAPYRDYLRGTDQYGYLAFQGNYYWVPGTRRDDLVMLEYADHIKINHGRECIATYALPPDGVTNQKFSPDGLPPPRFQPKHRKKPTEQEEQRLRSMSETVGAYLDFACKPLGQGRHRFLRKLFVLSKRMTEDVFINSIERAFKYKITSLETIERIAVLTLNQGPDLMFSVDIDEGFRERESYLEGLLTDQPDLSKYETPWEDNDDDDDDTTNTNNE